MPTTAVSGTKEKLIGESFSSFRGRNDSSITVICAVELFNNLYS